MEKQLLHGYNSQEISLKVENYPWGFKLKCDIFYWLESKPKHGDRFCSYTIDPRNGRINKPKCDKYVTFAYMYKNDEGHVKWSAIDFNCFLHELRDKLKQLEPIGWQNINEVQRANIRQAVASNVAIGHAYKQNEYSPEKLPAFKQWAKETVTYLMRCNFEDIAAFPEMPEPDIKD